MKKRNKISLTIFTVFIIAIISLLLFLNNQSQTSEEKFGIYLLENDELLISDKNIISYNKTSHEIKLNEEGFIKIKELQDWIGGTGFIIKFNGNDIYRGEFRSAISSIDYHGFVIVDFIFVDEEIIFSNNSIRIETGYPTSDLFEGEDLRNNSEIFDHFQRIGKLIE